MNIMKTIVVSAFILLSGVAQAAPFGGDADVQYANDLWSSMVSESYVGEGAIKSRPYTGQHPHGAILDTIEGPIVISGKIHNIIIKRNYGGPGVSKNTVANDPARFLKAVTIMLKRPGYDPENKDWFWAKYKASGEIDTNPKGVKLAGKIAKGKPVGCIACHTAAPGGDMVFIHD